MAGPFFADNFFTRCEAHPGYIYPPLRTHISPIFVETSYSLANGVSASLISRVAEGGFFEFQLQPFIQITFNLSENILARPLRRTQVSRRTLICLAKNVPTYFHNRHPLPPPAVLEKAPLRVAPRIFAVLEAAAFLRFRFKLF